MLAHQIFRVPIARRRAAAASLVLTVVVGGHTFADPPAASFYATQFARRPDVAAMSELGRTLFADPALSASGRVSCASCHDPAHDYGPPDAQPVRRAGRDGRQPGTRAVPSLRYLQAVPPFTEHYSESDGDGSDQGPAGGLTWDGRADSTHAQARLPLLSPLEMANASIAEVVAHLRAGGEAGPLRAVFGDDVFDRDERAEAALLMALEVFQQSPKDFYPYDSKYDWVLRGRAQLTEQEQRGLALFVDPRKGNCAQCHPSRIIDGAFPAFTDFGYVAIGAPRNRAIPANRDPQYFDLGLCGPAREDLREHREYCGMFRAPSLRNTARRPLYFHNGVFTRLEDVLRFYVTRDSAPERWYPKDRSGRALKFDDLPEAARANVDREAPFTAADGKPALNEAEIADLIAFLKTLDDGYVPAAEARR